MYIVDVIPLTTTPLSAPQILSYFCEEELPAGALVRISMHGRAMNALVEQCTAADRRKAAIKAGTVQLHPITAILSRTPLLTSVQWHLAAFIAATFASPLGAVCKAFLPRSLQRRKRQLTENVPNMGNVRYAPESSTTPTLLWSTQRSSHYLSHIKNNINGQILILVPQAQYIPIWEQWLAATVPDAAVTTFHSNLSVSEELHRWYTIAAGDARIIIGTRNALFLPYPELCTIIVDEEEHPNYQVWGGAPRFDTRRVAKRLSSLTASDMVCGSSFPSVFSYGKTVVGEWHRIQDSPAPAPLTNLGLIKLQHHVVKEEEAYISAPLKKAIQQQIEAGGNILLYVNRRGAAGALECMECGHTIDCGDCAAPMVYHQHSAAPLLLCHHCLKEISPPTVCPSCKGDRLQQLGQGTESVAKAVATIFPDAAVMRLDRDSASSADQQTKVIQQWRANAPAILIATQLVFSHMLTIENTGQLLAAVPLIDAQLQFPEYRTRERVLQTLARLCRLSNPCYVQTFASHTPFIAALAEKTGEELLQEEVERRRQLSYPPFGEIIQLQLAHPSQQTARDRAYRMRDALMTYAADNPTEVLGPTPAFIPKVGGQYLWQILLKCPDDYPTMKAEIARMLPRRWHMYVNPESLL